MEKDERCDNANAVFNARVNENEMIITIDEYTEMKDKIENFEKAKKEYQAYVTHLDQKLKEALDSNSNILSELKVVNEENRRLKQGLINFIKGVGG